MGKYLLEKLKMKENYWLGICKTKPERSITNSEDLITPSVGILVEHLEKHKILHLELIHYQSSIKEELTAGEADECWKTLLKCRKWCSLSPVQVKDLDTPFQQHDNLNVALESWYNRDYAVIFPGQLNLHGSGFEIPVPRANQLFGARKPEEPVIVSEPPHESFVVSKPQDTNLTHLRSAQQRTVNGVVAAESGVCVYRGFSDHHSETTGAQVIHPS
ncbi:testicular spindle-associated protein SHCBP1L [Pterocles gutturalis]